MKNLIIINQFQFFYNIATYYYCKYLKDNFDILYICWDHGLPKIELAGVRVVYVSRKGNMLVRSLRFLRHALKQINDDKRAIVFIKYFKGVSLSLRLLKPRHCFVLDIRTGSVHKNRLIRRFHDARLKLEAAFFKHVTVISESLAERLALTHKAHILPLGAEVISSTDKTFAGLHLLYVGTLFNRNMETTIHGFKQFYDEFQNQAPISYTIIGSGPNNEEHALKNLVAQYGLDKIVNTTGNIRHDLLKPFFDITNVGVSYVPLTDYYDVQPVTKTFEYFLSGMPVVATDTSENRKVVNQERGVLIGEAAEDFSAGLKAIFAEKNMFNSAKIRNAGMGYTWEKIVQSNLKPYLAGIIPEKH